MKKFLHFKKGSIKLLFLIVIVIKTTCVFSQDIPELIFNNGVIESGNAGEDGAKYRFSNVAPGIDAVIEVKGRSSALVVLSSIDTSGEGLGYTKAFQPVVGIPGIAPENTNWSMDFSLTFYNAGTNTRKTISRFNVTGLDIDGDGVSLSEWTVMGKLRSIDSALVNSLTFSWLNTWMEGDDYKVEGIIANAPGIDTTASNVMATYRYENKDQIDFTIGAKTNASTTTAGMRLNSLWFRDFFNPPLPVKLMSFTAVLRNNTTVLQWTTASEINVSHFTIEKSMDGTTYSDAGLVFAKGTTTEIINYSFSDNLPGSQSGVIYYRLRCIDIDGKSDYSAVRRVKTMKQSNDIISILSYPNPVTNEVLIIIPADWQNKKVIYELFSANGQAVKKMESAGSSQTETMNVSSLKSGLYIVRVSCEGQTAQQKIIKH